MKEENNQIWIPPLGEEVENSGVPRRKRVIGRRLKRMCVTDDCYRGVRLIVSFFSLSSSLFFNTQKKLCTRPVCLCQGLGPGHVVKLGGRWPARCFNKRFDFLGRRHARRTPWIPCVRHMTVGKHNFYAASYVGHTRHERVANLCDVKFDW